MFVAHLQNPPDETHIRCNIDQWKSARGLPTCTINFADMQNLDIEPYELSEESKATLGNEENRGDDTGARAEVHANDIHLYAQSSENDENNQEEEFEG